MAIKGWAMADIEVKGAGLWAPTSRWEKQMSIVKEGGGEKDQVPSCTYAVCMAKV